MRKLLALALVLVTASLGTPGGSFAQSTASAQLASISGEVVDAGGRALFGQRVELVRDGEILLTTTTGTRGEWSFTNITAGDYVVRVVINGQVAGIRVSATPGQPVTNALIVVPSAAAPSAAFLLALGLLGGIAVGTAVVVAIVATVVVATGS